jgi:serine/threonine-protein kinase
MIAETTRSAEHEDRLDAIITEYLESVERGESSDPGIWLQRYPDFAQALTLFFAAEQGFDRAVAPLRTPSVGASVGATPSVDRLSPDNTPDPALRPFRTVKDYDLLAEIGRGGMGIIYKARQRSLNRLVAVKMIRSAEWATPEERMRFRWEAEAVGALDHPNIVPIYEVGEFTSDDGVQMPFFSMKLIEGENLSQGRARFQNNWMALARLMVVIARAVEHAHQRGILHRDLKPANVLLGRAVNATPTGKEAEAPANADLTPHLTDFGLAARDQHHRGQTHTGTIVGTPAYLAPELASGEGSATITSDIYALGAILYELLSGEPPFRAGTPLETLRLLTTTSVKPPRKANSAIPLDLETICLKCLEREPLRRYATAGKLADDLELFLAGRPISARPVGSLSAFTRWCRRQPVIAGLGAALLLSVVIGVPLIAWNWQRAVENEQRAVKNELIAQSRLEDVLREREETLREREQAQNGFKLAHGAFGDLFRSLGDYRAEGFSETEELNKELLERGLRYYRDFVDRRKDDPEMRRELASTMFRIAAIVQRLHSSRAAIEAYDRVIGFIRSLLEQYPDDESLLELLSRSLSNRGAAQGRLDQFDEALRSFDAAAEVWSHYPETGAAVAQARHGQAIAIMNRGTVLRLKDDLPGALAAFKKAKAVIVKSNLPDRDLSPLVHCLISIAQTEDLLGHPYEVLTSCREAVETAEKMQRAMPDALESKYMLGQALYTKGKFEVRAGRAVEGKADLQMALRLLETVTHAKPKSTRYRLILAYAYGELGKAAQLQKKPDEAAPLLERATLHLRELTEVDGESRENRENLAAYSRALAEVFFGTKNYAAAIQAGEESRKHALFLVNRHPDNIQMRSDLGRACYMMGVALINSQKYQEAATALRESADNYQVALRLNEANSRVRKSLSYSLVNLALAFRGLGRHGDAITATDERLKLWKDSPNELYDAALDFARSFDYLAALAAKGAADPEARDRSVTLAIQALQQARKAGLPNLNQVRTEDTFKQIRETPEFKELLREKGPN